MAYRYGDRHQALMFPPTLEELIEPKDPVRAYDAFVDALDLDGLGVAIDVCKPGCP
jgi:hypothetical protein